MRSEPLRRDALRAVLVLGAFPLCFAALGYLRHELGSNTMLAFMLAGSFAIHLWTRPSVVEIGTTVLVAALLRWVYSALGGGFDSYFGSWLIRWGSFLGLASLFVLAAGIFRSRGEARKARLDTFYAAAIFPYLWVALGFCMALMIRWRPYTYDRLLFVFDGSLGFQPSFLLGQLLTKSSLALNLTATVYHALPLVVALVYASHRNRARGPVKIFELFVSLTAIGYLLYGVFPACGPIYAFPGNFPWDPPAISQVPPGLIFLPPFPRNCMPSLHFAAALQAWWNVRRWPGWARGLTGLFCLATAFSTLSLGEHYVADLIVAVPFTLAFQGAWTTVWPLTSAERLQPIVFGAGMTVLWFLLLRFGARLFLVSPAPAWIFTFVTLGGCWLLARRLARAPDVAVAPVLAASQKASAQMEITRLESARPAAPK